jgi:hypothetical protein
VSDLVKVAEIFRAAVEKATPAERRLAGRQVPEK